MLDNVSPTTASHYKADGALRDGELLGECCARFSVRRGISDANHIGCCQSSISVAFSLCSAALGFAVNHIRLLRSQEQMVGVDASRRIASVKDTRTFWYSAVQDLPRNSVRKSVAVVRADLAVALVVEGSCPKPTAILLAVNKCPKAFSDCSSLRRSTHRGGRAAMSPKASSMSIAKSARSLWVVATINDAYRFFSHSNLLSSAWLEPVAALQGSAGLSILYAESAAYKREP